MPSSLSPSRSTSPVPIPRHTTRRISHTRDTRRGNSVPRAVAGIHCSELSSINLSRNQCYNLSSKLSLIPILHPIGQVLFEIESGGLDFSVLNRNTENWIDWS